MGNTGLSARLGLLLISTPRACVFSAGGPERAPPANGHYSHAIVHRRTVYVSGQLGRGPKMSDAEAGDVTVQTNRALNSLREILHSAGSGFPHLIKVTIYIADIALWPAVDATYRAALQDHKPARAVVPTLPLHFNALVEIEGVATLADDV